MNTLHSKQVDTHWPFPFHCNRSPEPQQLQTSCWLQQLPVKTSTNIFLLYAALMWTCGPTTFWKAHLIISNSKYQVHKSQGTLLHSSTQCTSYILSSFFNLVYLYNIMWLMSSTYKQLSSDPDTDNYWNVSCFLPTSRSLLWCWCHHSQTKNQSAPWNKSKLTYL